MLKLPSVLGTLTHTKPEGIEGMSVDAIQLANQSDSKLYHDADLGLLPLPILKEHVTQQSQYECFVFMTHQ